MNSFVWTLKRYSDFSGRSDRREYWVFNLGNLLFYCVLYLLGLTVIGQLNAYVVMLIFLLTMFVPNVSVTVRRFHDINRSGWWVLTGLLPVVGMFILLVFMCLPGSSGDNNYGVSPSQEDLEDQVQSKQNFTTAEG